MRLSEEGSQEGGSAASPENTTSSKTSGADPIALLGLTAYMSDSDDELSS